MNKYYKQFSKRIDEPHEKIIFNIFLILTFSFIYKLLDFFDNSSFSQRLDIYDSIYFASITNFTLGYGDILPKTKIAKLFVILHSAIFWIVAIII